MYISVDIKNLRNVIDLLLEERNVAEGLQRCLSELENSDCLPDNHWRFSLDYQQKLMSKECFSIQKRIELLERMAHEFEKENQYLAKILLNERYKIEADLIGSDP